MKVNWYLFHLIDLSHIKPKQVNVYHRNYYKKKDKAKVTNLSEVCKRIHHLWYLSLE